MTGRTDVCPQTLAFAVLMYAGWLHYPRTHASQLYEAKTPPITMSFKCEHGTDVQVRMSFGQSPSLSLSVYESVMFSTKQRMQSWNPQSHDVKILCQRASSTLNDSVPEDVMDMMNKQYGKT